MKSAQTEAATARPWTTEYAHNREGRQIVLHYELGERDVLRTPGDSPEDHANIALIVRCVNGYDALEARVLELEAALNLAVATINRVHPPGAPFSSVQGTLDVCAAAMNPKA